MSFQPLQRVLGNLEGQYHRAPKQLAQIQGCWNEAVGEVVAGQTRPCNFYQGVLKVATSSAGWAQNLVFERQRILEKLNKALPFQVNDIRFSTAQWHDLQTSASFPGDEQQSALWQAHPSRIQNLSTQQEKRQIPDPELEEGKVDPIMAFQGWAEKMRSRSKHLPLCPQCDCPTPAGELERWQQCAVCVAKQWQQK